VTVGSLSRHSSRHSFQARRIGSDEIVRGVSNVTDVCLVWLRICALDNGETALPSAGDEPDSGLVHIDSFIHQEMAIYEDSVCRPKAEEPRIFHRRTTLKPTPAEGYSDKSCGWAGKFRQWNNEEVIIRGKIEGKVELAHNGARRLDVLREAPHNRLIFVPAHEYQTT